MGYGKISRAECFKHEVAVSCQKDPGPIILLAIEELHREAERCLLPDWITRPPPADKTTWPALVSECERVSAAEEGMTVEEYRALNKRRLKDPFCD